jgi:ferric-dicitrate binding protein FerR (iron transport regulator)
LLLFENLDGLKWKIFFFFWGLGDGLSFSVLLINTGMNPEILRKFFKGDCSPEEVHAILRWINSEQGKTELGRFFEKHDEDFPLDPDKSREMFERISHSVNYGEELERRVTNPIEVVSPRYSNTRVGSFRMGIVAACLVVLAMGWFIAHSFFGKGDTVPTIVYHLEWIERSVAAGQKLKLTLEDGSEVTVNSLSTIRFPKKFAPQSREVVVEGEAFFHVTPDSNRPFLVRSGQVVTRVLGTSFLVKSGEGGQPSQVAVLTGKVQVSLANTSMAEKSVLLGAMDGVSVNGDASFQKKQVGYDDIFAWKDDVISFNNSTFSEVVTRLEKWYGVKILLPDHWEPQKQYSGRFQSQSLEEVLLGLSFVYDFQFRIRNDTVTIYH